jgi:hypothetical protein
MYTRLGLCQLALLPLMAFTLFNGRARAAHASLSDSTALLHQHALRTTVGEPVSMLGSDSVAVSVMWTATGGTITPSGLYIANQAGTFQVEARTADGRLADTATITVMSPLTSTASVAPAAESLSTPKYLIPNSRISVEVGAPAVTMACNEKADFIRIDRGFPIMFAGSKRQIKVGGCYHGRPIAAVAYAYVSEGELTPEMRYESDAVPGVVTFEVGSSDSPARARAELLVVPNLLQWGFLLALYRFWRDRKRRPSPPTEKPIVPASEGSFFQARSSGSIRTLGCFKVLQRTCVEMPLGTAGSATPVCASP